jgi:hypothetical protein
MAKVFGMHMIGLRPGVSGEDFEQFFREKVAPLPQFNGQKMYLLKGDRGDRDGKYLVMFEGSLDLRNKMSPTPDQPSEELQQFFEAHKDVFDPMFAEWEKLASGIGAPTIYTDYVVVGESA